MTQPTHRPADDEITAQATRALRQADGGDPDGAGGLDTIATTSPASVEAAEQEAHDGPPGLGLAR